MKQFLIPALVALPLPVPAQDSDATDPTLAFNNHCRTCHSQDEGDNRLGPNLYQVIGREAGSLEGYRYSDALARADFAWDAEQLEAFIENPEAVVPGHNMKPYSGIADPEVRSAILQALEEN